MMRWYDYLFCMSLANLMARDLTRLLLATSPLEIVWYGGGIALSYLVFGFYADWRKEEGEK